MPAGRHALKATGAAVGGGVAVLSQSVAVTSASDAGEATDTDGASVDNQSDADSSAALPATGAPVPFSVVAAVALLTLGTALVSRNHLYLT